MGEMNLNLSSIVALLTIVLVVVGLVFALFWFFKKAESLDDDDRLHIERAKISWIGAAALALLTLVSIKKEKTFSIGGMSMGGRSSASLL